MKKLIFLSLLALTIIACNNEEATEDSNVDVESVKQIENATIEVTEGTKQMEQEVEDLGGEIDELLNDI